MPQANGRANPVSGALWRCFCVLRDGGLSPLECVEQLTYLLFLREADRVARSARAAGSDSAVLPVGRDWSSLAGRSGPDLEFHYRELLSELAGRSPKTLVGAVFAGAQYRIPGPAVLQGVIVDLSLDDGMRPNAGLTAQAYRGLLDRCAEDVQSGAGQYVTPHPLVEAMIEVVQPRPSDTITDPACGTGGFLVAAHRYICEHHLQDLSVEGMRRLHSPSSIWGQEMVASTGRLAAMNMLLHGTGSAEGPSPITVGDALARPPSRQASVVLAHPPFGTRTPDTGDRAATGHTPHQRDDFPVTTTHQQINFLQHVMSLMQLNGRAAVVLPDNVLFASQEYAVVRRRLLEDFDLHTILRLPTGIFYATGVRANVLFFDRRPPRADGGAGTSKLWIYDLRTHQQFSPKHTPLRRADLEDFVEAYRPGRPRTDREETERFRCFDYSEVIARERTNLDISWAQDSTPHSPESLLPPEVIAAEIIEDLQTALREFAAVAEALDEATSAETDRRQQESG